MTEAVVDLNPVTEYKNICPNCGKENTLYPRFRGKRKFYICDEDIGGCGETGKGITKKQWDKNFAEGKEHFINAWNNHIKQLWSLAFCEVELSKEVQVHIQSLLDLVPKIAETKTKFQKRY